MKSAHAEAIQAYKEFVALHGPVHLKSIPPPLGYVGFLQGQVEDKHHPLNAARRIEPVDRMSRDPDEYAVHDSAKPRASY